MTTKDNQNVRISIAMTTQTPAGIDWKGEVEISGPYDDKMLDQVVELSDQLAEKAMEQRAISRRTATAEECLETLPQRPRRTRRTKAQMEADEAGAEETEEASTEGHARVLAELNRIDPPDSMQTLGPPDIADDDLPF
jgi:hypothetical protein